MKEYSGTAIYWLSAMDRVGDVAERYREILGRGCLCGNWCIFPQMFYVVRRPSVLIWVVSAIVHCLCGVISGALLSQVPQGVVPVGWSFGSQTMYAMWVLPPSVALVAEILLAELTDDVFGDFG
uniref:Uncharacterized protein n=1 Tax=Fagus sylvatica TaxID=28930 RepID=A0A2N9J7L0_FAGSY